MRNKKAKQCLALQKRAHKKKEGLAASTSEIAQALNRRAVAMEEVADIQLFSINLSNLDEKAREFMLLKRSLAESELQKRVRIEINFNMGDVVPRGPLAATKENVAPPTDDENLRSSTQLSGTESWTRHDWADADENAFLSPSSMRSTEVPADAHKEGVFATNDMAGLYKLL